ncbi:excalibur calcium-binding domain-containing protein [Bacillus sp. JJ722]
MDCTDFSSQSAAQFVYEAAGGPSQDPHDLDRDNDGTACDSN